MYQKDGRWLNLTRERKDMLSFILALLLFMQIGCSGIATYITSTAGTLSGQVLHDAVKDHQADKEKDGETK